jgi:hypothetical protein
MRAWSRRGSAVLARSAGIAALALCLAAEGAQAAFAPVDPELVAHAERIEEALPSVSPTGEQIVLYRELAPVQALDARVRAAGGEFGAVQTLTRESNFELPQDLPFNSSGEAFAAWGIATVSAHGEFTTRGPGALFGAAQENSSCSRFTDASVGPHDELAVACDREEAPGKFRMTFSESSSIALFPGATSVLGPLVESEFLQPITRYGADGTVAVAWDYQSATEEFADVAVRDAGSKAGPTAQTLFSAATGAGKEASVESMAVTANGTTIVIVGRGSEGLFAYVRPAGGVFTPVQLASSEADGTVGVDAAGDAVVMVEKLSLSGSTIQYAVRPPGGSFGALQDVVPGGSFASANLTVAPDGTVFAELFPPGSSGFDAAVRPPGGSFGSPMPVAGPGATFPSFAVTPGDDLLASWVLDSDGDHTLDSVFVGGLDSGTPPELSSVSVPSAALLGAAGTFSAQAADAMGVRGVHWSFGDGASSDGESVSHAYSSTGTFTVTVTATDRAGNATTATRTIVVVDTNAGLTSTVGISPAPGTGPTIALKLPRSVRFKSLLRSGVTVEVTTSEPATVLGNLLGRARGGRIASVGDLVIASKTLKNVGSRRKLVLRPAPSRLGKRRSLSLTVQVVATGAKGLQRSVARTLKVTR